MSPTEDAAYDIGVAVGKEITKQVRIGIRISLTKSLVATAVALRQEDHPGFAAVADKLVSVARQQLPDALTAMGATETVDEVIAGWEEELTSTQGGHRHEEV